MIAWRKAIYLFVALALVLGLVPSAVMAMSPRELPAVPGYVVDWNVFSTPQTWTIPLPADATGWHFTPKDGLGAGGFTLLSGGGPGDTNATVKASTLGSLEVDVTDTNGTAYQGEKKWGKIWSTELTRWQDKDEDWILDIDEGELVPISGSTLMKWFEANKTWYGSGQVWEEVIGAFNEERGSGFVLTTHPADGAIVHWYLFDAALDITYLNRCDNGTLLKEELDNLLAWGYGAKHVWFAGTAGSQYTQTVSGDWGVTGLTSVIFEAEAEEAVRIICLADYPTPQGTQHLVCPEFFSWTFWTQEMEKVPQVRWAGEKIVLEKYWGEELNGAIVHYALEQMSPGTLEAVPLADNTGEASFNTRKAELNNEVNTATSVWTMWSTVPHSAS